MTEDRRKDKARRPLGYMVATDAFMSGWGGAKGGRSLYAVACHTPEEADIVSDNFDNRTEFRRPRWISTLKADGTPRVRMAAADHLAVVDAGGAASFYIRHYFADQACLRRHRDLQDARSCSAK